MMSEKPKNTGGSRLPSYNAAVVLRNVPEIMGLELTMKGEQWQGAYRLTGERCGHRRDKMKVFAWKGAVWVQEEGEPLVSIQKWLVEYGGCADDREAMRLLRTADPSRRMQELVIARAARKEEGKYVTLAQWREYADYELDRCPLYLWMCRLFDTQEATRAFQRYVATTNVRGEMVYWYVDVDGNICHDKVMAYNSDGHRDKNRGGWRRFTTTDGYTNRCYYGSHLLADACGEGEGEAGAVVAAKRVMVVEGEKTAMMCSIVWPEYVWMATGGKNQLRDVEPGWTLLPDVDAADEWSSRGSVSRWWEMYEECGEHSDIGDMIEFNIKRGALRVLRYEEVKELLFDRIN